MTLKKGARTAVTALGVASLAILVGASPATANHDSGGVEGDPSLSCFAAYYTGRTINLMDYRYDNAYCYIIYTWVNGSGGRFNHPRDYGVGNWYPYTMNDPRASTFVQWSVCKEVPNGPDSCSRTFTDPK